MVILVTGATSGLGYSITTHLAALGHTIIAAGRRVEKLDSLPEAIRSNVHPLKIDVRDRDAVLCSLERSEDDIGPIEALVNNAGLALGLEPAFSASLDDWVQMVDTNVLGLLYCTYAVLPKMVQRNYGHIINLGSVAGSHPYPGGNVYGATKAFVHQFSLSLRADLVGRNVHVTNIEPGLCGSTEFSVNRFHGNREKADEVYKHTKPLVPDDIASLVAWLLSLPEHVNINHISLMPTCQGFGNFVVARTV